MIELKWRVKGKVLFIHAQDVADSVFLSLDGEGGGIDDLGVPLVRDPIFNVVWKKKKNENEKVEIKGLREESVTFWCLQVRRNAHNDLEHS